MMHFDSKHDTSNDLSLHDEWMLYSLFAHVVFNTFVRAVVRDRFAHLNPHRVTVQSDPMETVLFVYEDGRVSMYQDDELHDWVFGFIAGDVLHVDPDDIQTIYLDGMVGTEEPYLFVAGDGVMLSCGEPLRKGRLL